MQPDKYFLFTRTRTRAISRVLLTSSVFKGVLINGITGTSAMESAINESVTGG